ncbi:MAG: hypothetical protein AAB225_01100 [Acidobacteriota bacterium]
MIVVSDTSPILNLALIGRLDLLAALYGQVLIPRAVFEELERSQSEAPLIAPGSSSWLVVASAQNRARVDHLSGELDLLQPARCGLQYNDRAMVRRCA